MNVLTKKAIATLVAVVLTGGMAAASMEESMPQMSSSDAGMVPSVTVGVDAASAYVFRGVTLNDGFVVQPYVEVEVGGLSLEVWGNIDLESYDGTLETNQFSEIDIAIAYGFEAFEALDVSLEYCEYTYPGAEGKADREVGIGLSAGLPLSPSLFVAYGFDGGIAKTVYVELGFSYESEIASGIVAELGATVGYLAPDEGDSGFSHYTVSAGLSKGIFVAGITYIGQIDDDVLPDGPGAYDVDLYGTIGVSYTF